LISLGFFDFFEKNQSLKKTEYPIISNSCCFAFENRSVDAWSAGGAPLRLAQLHHIAPRSHAVRPRPFSLLKS
jgi:hypothetical protein